MGIQQHRKHPLPVVRAAHGHEIFLLRTARDLTDRLRCGALLQAWRGRFLAVRCPSCGGPRRTGLLLHEQPSSEVVHRHDIHPLTARLTGRGRNAGPS